MKTTTRSRVAALLVGAAGVVIVELLLRLFIGPTAPPVRVYSIFRTGEAWFTEAAGQVSSSTFQVHPVEASFTTEMRAPRVAVLGGSVVHGGSGSLRLDQEFPALIEKRTLIDVYNFGSPALDSHDHVKQMTELVRWPWSLIVVYAGHNDFGNAYFQQRYSGAGSWIGVSLRSVAEHFQLFSLLRRAAASAEGFAPRPGTGPPKGAATTSEQREATLRYLEMNLRRIAWIAASAGIPLMWVVPFSSVAMAPVEGACAGDPCASRLWEEGTRLVRQDPVLGAEKLRQARDADNGPLRAPTAAEELVRRIAGETGDFLADPAQKLPKEPATDLPSMHLFADHVHLSETGHALTAAALAEDIQAALR